MKMDKANTLDKKMIKYLEINGKKWLLDIFRMAWEAETIPKD